MINIYILIILILFLSLLIIYLLYEILSPFHEKIFIFFTKKGKKEMKYLMSFIKNLGPSISAVSVVAIFIPIKEITFGILSIVFFLGIMLSRAASYIEEKITQKET